MNSEVQVASTTNTQRAPLVDALRQASRALQSYLVAQARATGLGLIEFLILIRATEADGVSARDAGRAFGLNTSTMTGIADRLEQDKLLRRHPHPSDRRVLLLKATPQGRRLVERAVGPLLDELDRLAATLRADQRSQSTSVLEQITALVLEHGQTSGARRSPSGAAPRRQRQPRPHKRPSAADLS